MGAVPSISRLRHTRRRHSNPTSPAVSQLPKVSHQSTSENSNALTDDGCSPLPANNVHSTTASASDKAPISTFNVPTSLPCLGRERHSTLAPLSDGSSFLCVMTPSLNVRSSFSSQVSDEEKRSRFVSVLADSGAAQQQQQQSSLSHVNQPRQPLLATAANAITSTHVSDAAAFPGDAHGRRSPEHGDAAVALNAVSCRDARRRVDGSALLSSNCRQLCSTRAAVAGRGDGLSPLFGSLEDLMELQVRCGPTQLADDSASIFTLASACDDVVCGLGEVGGGADSVVVDVEGLLRSWGIMCERDDALVEDLCTFMAAQHTEHAKLFATSSPGEQARVMLNMIGETLGVLSGLVDSSAGTQRALGALHRRYSVDEEHFRVLQSAFMSVLPRYLPADLQSDCAAAWAPFWTITAPDLRSGAVLAHGAWHAAEQPHLLLAESRRVIGQILFDKTPSQYGALMVELVRRAAEVDPAMERFASLREPRVAVRAFNCILRVLERSDDAAAVERLMRELLYWRTTYGLDAAGMHSFRQPFIDTCRHTLLTTDRASVWGPLTSRSLGAFWDCMVTSWATTLRSVEIVRTYTVEPTKTALLS